MSAGRSSQVAACFSVERTKYLMLSKSMPDRSAPQRGIGFFSNRPSALSRNSSIHCGLVLQRGDVGDDVGREAPARGGARDVRVGPAEVVAAERRERLLLRERGRSAGLPQERSSCGLPPCRSAGSAGWWCADPTSGVAGRSARGSRVADRPVGAFGSLERDVCGARGVAARDGGQALHVRAEQLGERRGLGLAQLRELGRHVGDRAVVLAELHAPVARCRLADLRGVPAGGQHPGERVDPVLRRAGGAAPARRPDRAARRSGCAANPSTACSPACAAR